MLWGHSKFHPSMLENKNRSKRRLPLNFQKVIHRSKSPTQSTLIERDWFLETAIRKEDDENWLHKPSGKQVKTTRKKTANSLNKRKVEGHEMERMKHERALRGRVVWSQEIQTRSWFLLVVEKHKTSTNASRPTITPSDMWKEPDAQKRCRGESRIVAVAVGQANTTSTIDTTETHLVDVNRGGPFQYATLRHKQCSNHEPDSVGIRSKIWTLM